MKKTLLILIIISGSLASFGQLCNPPAGQTFTVTDPDNYYNPKRDPNQTLKWDWRGDFNYTMYINGGNNNFYTSTPRSPFFFPNGNAVYSSNENIFTLRAGLIKDYEPSDGWELLYKNFGTGLNVNDAVAYPGFALYNRYQSKVKIFVYIPTNVNYNGAIIRVRFSNGQNSKNTFLLSPTKPIVTALEQSGEDGGIVNIQANATQVYQQNGDYWLCSDFPVQYDPCTCKHLSILSIEPWLINTGDIKLQSQGSMVQNKSIVSAGATSDQFGINTIFDFISGLATSGEEGYGTMEKFKNASKAVVASQNPEIKADQDAAIEKLLPAVLAYGPEIGAAIGIFKFLTAGGESADGNNQAPMSFTSNQEIKGSLTYQVVSGGVTLYVPGTDHSAVNIQPAPVYDEVLGVFNLIDIPRLEFVEYTSPLPDPIFCINGKDEFGNSKTNYSLSFPKIREYKITDNDIKYVVNPAAGFEEKPLSIEASIVFTPRYYNAPPPPQYPNQGWDIPRSQAQHTIATKHFRGPAEIGQFNANQSYKDRLKALNLFINYWPDDPNTVADDKDITNIEYSTRMLPISCIKYTPSFRVFHQLDDEKEIYFKVKVVLKRKNASASTQPVIFVYTYKMRITSSNLNENLHYTISSNGEPTDVCFQNNKFLGSIDPTPFTQNQQLNIVQEDYDLNNVVIGSNFPAAVVEQSTLLAWNKIHIGNNVTFDPAVTNWTFKANEIVVDPDFTVPAGMNVNFVIGKYSPCETIQLPATKEEIEAYCQSTKYNPTVKSNKKEDELPILALNPTDGNQLSSFEIFPNPFKENSTLSYSILKGSNIKIIISNMMGQDLFTLQNQFQYAGHYNLPFSLKEYRSGIYHVQILGDDFKETKRICIVKE